MLETGLEDLPVHKEMPSTAPRDDVCLEECPSRGAELCLAGSALIELGTFLRICDLFLRFLRNL